MDPFTMAAVSQKIASAGQTVAGGAQIVQGLVQKKQAKKINRSNIRPDYYAPDEIGENNDIAASRAGRGLSDASYQAFVANSNNAFTAGIDAITKNGGSANNIADLYGNVTGGFRNLAMLDEQMRANNINQFMQSNNQVAEYKDKEWQINQWAPYADKAQAAAQLSKQGSDNLWKGINTVVSAAANASTSQQYGQEGANVFPKPDPNVFNSFSQAPAPPPTPSPGATNSIRMQWPGLLYGKGAMETNQY